MGYLRTFGRILEFGKFEVANYKYDNSFLKFVMFQNFVKKLNFVSLGLKMPYFIVFGLEV